MQRILVTGSLGYIGSVLTEYLNTAGFECIGYDTGFFKNSLLYPTVSTGTIVKDAREIGDADLIGIDAVVHLAGISNDPIGKLDAARIYDPTRDYSLKIAKLCKKYGIKFIFASSCSIYGVGSDSLLTENSPVSPQTQYSKNKLEVEADLESISDQSFSPIALRFATIFGASPRIRLDVVVNMLTAMAVSKGSIILNSNGLSWRPHLHILDACQAIRCAIEYQEQSGKLLVLNVGMDSNNLRVIDVARIVQNAVPESSIASLLDNPNLDAEGLIRDRKTKNGGEDTRTYKVSFKKIKQVFPSFECEWSVAEGIAGLVAHFKSIGLTSTQYAARKFYRLQQLEDLHEQGQLTDDLFWIPQPVKKYD